MQINGYESQLRGNAEKCFQGSQRKAKTGKTAEFIEINEHVEPAFNDAMTT
ncbi:hypothetical protein GCM10011613_19460 [Cellvibrio zantedeschiae]|uniref:Uncharacterized protein n=1 Tax=Cellvibrio zantedeschiae TaxID=1237077 RepID=A0ABQ3B5F7_9GAMM|nr:hypothetical protein GCM10011613_19460 [Cellvibrio zantedeschiae]